MNDSRGSNVMKVGCIVAVVSVLFAATCCIGGGVFLVNRNFRDFDVHRDKMAIREGLAVEDEVLRYSPGMDAAMWCKFTVEADDVSEVFDAGLVDVSEFNQDDFTFGVDWIDDDWWDADDRQLVGGEVELMGDYMRVGYEDNGDGTLTIYIFWFEV